MLWSPSIIRPSLQNTGLRLLRLRLSSGIKSIYKQKSFLVLLLKRLLVLILAVCRPTHNKSVLYSVWICAHNSLLAGHRHCMQPNMSWPATQKETPPNTRIQMWFFEHAKIADERVVVAGTWNPAPCERFDSTVRMELRNRHANTKGVS